MNFSSNQPNLFLRNTTNLSGQFISHLLLNALFAFTLKLLQILGIFADYNKKYERHIHTEWRILIQERHIMRKYFVLNILAALFIYVYGCGDKKTIKKLTEITMYRSL
jgi:ABC-type multidrug transport system permease subunit